MKTDKAILDWLNERLVDSIYLDDGQLIDVQGNDIRRAVSDAMEKEPDLEDEARAEAELAADIQRDEHLDEVMRDCERDEK